MTITHDQDSKWGTDSTYNAGDFLFCKDYLSNASSTGDSLMSKESKTK